jgi:hypothetical protein
MSSLIEQYELIKEIHYRFDELDAKIIGRIYRIVKGVTASFMWDINYFCKLEDEISYYTPSAPYSDSIEGAENRLFKYVQRFEKTNNIIKNNTF